MKSAHLARVFDLETGFAGGQRVEMQAAAARADGRRRGQPDLELGQFRRQRLMPARAKSPIAFQTCLLYTSRCV